jgi:ATP-dependent Clp protease ATP-binding subunit ClpA
MADLALPRQLHAIGRRAIAEAVARRATSVGTEHVLLAIAAKPDAPSARVLADAGLDYRAITAAIEAERHRSLAVADVRPVDPDVLASSPRATKPVWGASIRALLRAADKPAAKAAARAGREGALEIELTLGILRAELGTVPRMLALVGVDRRAIAERLRAISG